MSLAIKERPGFQQLLQNRHCGFGRAECLVADCDHDAIKTKLPLSFRNGVVIVDDRKVKMVDSEVNAEPGKL